MLSRTRVSHVALAAALLAGASGCDDPARTAGEIVAARGECSEDSLRAGAEACVDMFQRYAEIGTRAIQTYIGGIKALQEAVDRMPPPQFDTVGLGRAFGPGVGARYPGEYPYPGAGAYPPEWEPARRLDTGYGWPLPEGGHAPGAIGAAPWDPSLPSATAWPQRYPELDDRRPAPPGVLLPPEQRLRRPWISPEFQQSELSRHPGYQGYDAYEDMEENWYEGPPLPAYDRGTPGRLP
jgi:hypothetical protein